LGPAFGRIAASQRTGAKRQQQTSTFFDRLRNGRPEGKSRPDHDKFRISGGRRNDVTALGPRQALIKGIAIAKIRRNWQFYNG